jgi:hypothetical protein
MSSLNTCKNCSTQLQVEQKLFGGLIEISEAVDLMIECETHPNHRAVGFCIICGRPVCSECEVMSAGKILCADPEHRIVLQEWNVMSQLGSEFEADALVRNLTDDGIKTKTFSLHDHVAAHWLNENRVLLFVRKLDYEKGKALLKELNLIGNY